MMEWRLVSELRLTSQSLRAIVVVAKQVSIQQIRPLTTPMSMVRQ